MRDILKTVRWVPYTHTLDHALPIIMEAIPCVRPEMGCWGWELDQFGEWLVYTPNASWRDESVDFVTVYEAAAYIIDHLAPF